jgi:hypothetical protein
MGNDEDPDQQPLVGRLEMQGKMCEVKSAQPKEKRRCNWREDTSCSQLQKHENVEHMSSQHCPKMEITEISKELSNDTVSTVSTKTSASSTITYPPVCNVYGAVAEQGSKYPGSLYDAEEVSGVPMYYDPYMNTVIECVAVGSVNDTYASYVALQASMYGGYDTVTAYGGYPPYAYAPGLSPYIGTIVPSLVMNVMQPAPLGPTSFAYGYPPYTYNCEVVPSSNKRDMQPAVAPPEPTGGIIAVAGAGKKVDGNKEQDETDEAQVKNKDKKDDKTKDRAEVAS